MKIQIKAQLAVHLLKRIIDGDKIKYDDYQKLSDNEMKEYNVYPKMQVFRVFNVAQTNLQEARPELWQRCV